MRDRLVLWDRPLSAPNGIFCTFCTPIWDRTPTTDHSVTAEGAFFRRRDHCIYINVYFEFIIIFIVLLILFFFITFFSLQFYIYILICIVFSSCILIFFWIFYICCVHRNFARLFQITSTYNINHFSKQLSSLTTPPILKFPVEKKTQWINILQICLPKQRKKHTVLHIHPQAHLLHSLQVNLRLPLTKGKIHTPPQTIQTEHPRVNLCQKIF